MKKIMQRHPVTSFFVIAFAISWAVWLSLLAVHGAEGSTVLLIILIGAFGPALSGFICASVQEPGKSGGHGMRQWMLWAAATIVILPLAINWSFLKGHAEKASFYFLALILSGLAGFIVSGSLSRRNGVRRLMSPLLRWRERPLWYLYAIVSWPVVLLATNMLDILLHGGSAGDYFSSLGSFSVGRIIIAFMTTMFIAAPFQEEPGWRAFALDRLQRGAYSPLVASAIVGIMWQLWHLPLYFVGLYPFSVADMLSRLITFLPGAIIYTWLWNRTRGNFLILVLFHASNDAFSQLLPLRGAGASRLFDIVIFAWGIALLCSDRMWKRIPLPEKYR